MCEVIKNNKALCLKVTPHHLMTSHRQVDKGGIVNKFKTNKRSTKQKEDHRSDDIQLNIEKMITIIVEHSTKVREEKRKTASFVDCKQYQTIRSTHANSITITKEKRK